MRRKIKEGDRGIAKVTGLVGVIRRLFHCPKLTPTEPLTCKVSIGVFVFHLFLIFFVCVCVVDLSKKLIMALTFHFFFYFVFYYETDVFIFVYNLYDGSENQPTTEN